MCTPYQNNGETPDEMRGPAKSQTIQVTWTYKSKEEYQTKLQNWSGSTIVDKGFDGKEYYITFEGEVV